MPDALTRSLIGPGKSLECFHRKLCKLRGRIGGISRAVYAKLPLLITAGAPAVGVAGLIDGRNGSGYGGGLVVRVVAGLLLVRCRCSFPCSLLRYYRFSLLPS